MKKKIIAHFTDTHLGQRLVVGGDTTVSQRLKHRVLIK